MSLRVLLGGLPFWITLGKRKRLHWSRAEANSRVDSLAFKLVQARAYIHSTLSVKYGRDSDEPSEPQLVFRLLQTKLAEREEALRVSTAEVGTLQALLKTERQGSTSNSTLEKELVCLWHSHGRLREIAKDLGFDAVGLLHTHAYDDLILHTSFGRLC